MTTLDFTENTKLRRMEVAAPTMLKAIEKYIVLVDRGTLISKSEMDDCRASFRAAIKAATGGA
jgi:hypothetical protein